MALCPFNGCKSPPCPPESVLLQTLRARQSRVGAGTEDGSTPFGRTHAYVYAVAYLPITTDHVRCTKPPEDPCVGKVQRLRQRDDFQLGTSLPGPAAAPHCRLPLRPGCSHRQPQASLVCLSCPQSASAPRPTELCNRLCARDANASKRPTCNVPAGVRPPVEP